MNFTRNTLLFLAGFIFITNSVIAQFEIFCTKYDTLSTIAGKGVISGKGVNGWLPEYEGGSAVDAELSRPHFSMADGEGNLTTVFKDSVGIAIGRGLWVSPDEDLIYYASNSRIKKWTADGGVTDYSTGFSSLGMVVVDPSGFVVATDRSGNRVFEDGSKVVIAGNGSAFGGGDGFDAIETGIYGVRGVWFLEDESYLLATHEGSQIWYVDTLGIIHLFLDGMEGDEYHTGDGEHF